MFNLLKFVFSPHQWVELFTFYGGGKDGGDAPDFTALAAAAEKSAELGYKLGSEQLAENKSQYDQNMAVTTPVVNAQLGLMNMTKEQGDDYFNYMKSYARPVEQQLYYEAMGFTPEEVQQIEGLRTSETQAAKEAAAANVTKTYIPATAGVEATEGKQPLSYDQWAARQSSSGQLVPISQHNSMGGIIVDSWGMQPVDKSQAAYQAYLKANPAKAGTAAVAATEGRYENVNDPKDLSIVDTPETNALTSKLSMQAKARMDALDQAGRDKILNKNNELAGRIGETDTQVYNRYADDIEAEAGQAVADARAGYTNSVNSAIRQGIRYGFAPNKLLANANTLATQQAGQQAAAANQTRKSATQVMYGRGVGQVGEELKGMTADRNYKIQDSAIATAKKQDVAGLYRNLPAASQGSYSLATNAGNSAVNNQNQTSSQYMQGVNQGNGLIMQGQQTAVQGLGSMVGAQTSYAGQGDSGAGIGALGTVVGAGIAAY